MKYIQRHVWGRRRGWGGPTHCWWPSQPAAPWPENTHAHTHAHIKTVVVSSHEVQGGTTRQDGLGLAVSTLASVDICSVTVPLQFQSMGRSIITGSQISFRFTVEHYIIWTWNFRSEIWRNLNSVKFRTKYCCVVYQHGRRAARQYCV